MRGPSSDGVTQYAGLRLFRPRFHARRIAWYTRDLPQLRSDRTGVQQCTSGGEGYSHEDRDMWTFILVLWIGGFLGTLGSIMSQHLEDSVKWPRAEETMLMVIMSALWFTAIPYSLYTNRPQGD